MGNDGSAAKIGNYTGKGKHYSYIYCVITTKYLMIFVVQSEQDAS